MVGILSQYFGDPINCDFKGLDKHMANDYCWIHGSPYIPHGEYQYQRHIMKCIVEYEDLKNDKDDVPYTAYYQVICLTWTPSPLPKAMKSSPLIGPFLSFRILGIFSVENIKRLCVFMFQTCSSYWEEYCESVQSRLLEQVWNRKPHNLFIFSAE